MKVEKTPNGYEVTFGSDDLVIAIDGFEKDGTNDAAVVFAELRDNDGQVIGNFTPAEAREFARLMTDVADAAEGQAAELVCWECVTKRMRRKKRNEPSIRIWWSAIDIEATCGDCGAEEVQLWVATSSSGSTQDTPFLD